MKPPSDKASTKLRLRSETSFDRQLYDLYRAFLGRALEEAVTDNGEDGVHEARKCLKKARALLRLMPIPVKERQRAKDICRLAGRELGARRDALVAAQTALALADRAEGAGADWLNHFAKRQTLAIWPTGRPLSSALARRLRRHSIATERWNEHALSAGGAAKKIVKAYQRARSAYREARSCGSDAGLFHEWRKRAKEHWYHIRWISEALPRPIAEGWAKALAEISDLLGEDHDLSVLAEQLRPTLGKPEDRQAAFAALRRRQAKLRRKALQLGNLLFALRPETLRKALGETLREATGDRRVGFAPPPPPAPTQPTALPGTSLQILN